METTKYKIGTYFHEILSGAVPERTLELLTDGEFVLAYSRFDDWPAFLKVCQSVIRERALLNFSGTRRDVCQLMSNIQRAYAPRSVPKGWVFISRKLRETDGPCLVLPKDLSDLHADLVACPQNGHAGRT
jgi:hypothetical protein